LTRRSFFASLAGRTVYLLEPQDVHAGVSTAPVVMVEQELPNTGLSAVAARASSGGRS
jgi:hypothetical protein